MGRTSIRTVASLAVFAFVLAAPLAVMAAEPAKQAARKITNADLPKTPHVSVLGTLKVAPTADPSNGIDAAAIAKEYQFYAQLSAERAARADSERAAQQAPPDDPYATRFAWRSPWVFGSGLVTNYGPWRPGHGGHDGHDGHHGWGFLGSGDINPSDGLLPNPGVNQQRDPLYPPVGGYPGRVGKINGPNGPTPSTIRGRTINQHQPSGQR